MLFIKASVFLNSPKGHPPGVHLEGCALWTHTWQPPTWKQISGIIALFRVPFDRSVRMVGELLGIINFNMGILEPTCTSQVRVAHPSDLLQEERKLWCIQGTCPLCPLSAT